MRAFIALELPEPVRAALADLQSQLAQSGADVAWVHPLRLHVTMRFLGEITDAQRRQLEAGAGRIASASPPFDVRLTQPGAFPSMRAPRVVWVGIGQGSDALVELAEGLERESVKAGLQEEERGFVAHVTIGRVRSPKKLQALSDALAAGRWQAPAPFEADSLTLFESVLQRGGPVYTALARLSMSSAD